VYSHNGRNFCPFAEVQFPDHIGFCTDRGYLPIFSITGISAIAYGAMVYFVILNLLALIIAVNKKWAVTAYIGFVLNVIGSVYIASIMFGGLFAPSEFSFDSVITIIYILFAFVIYTLIPIAEPSGKIEF